MADGTQKTVDLRNPMTADQAIKRFLGNPENERLYRESEIRLDVSECMRTIRKHQGVTQEQMADRVGCSQPFIAKLEKGAYERIGLSNLRTYARALGYDINVDSMLYPLGAPVYTGYSSTLSLEEALRHEEALAPKIATLFAAAAADMTFEKCIPEATLEECVAAA